MSDKPPARAALGLRVVHTVVFLCFTALAVSAASPELSQLRFAIAGPYHAGTPPFWPALIGAALAVGGAALMLVRVVQNKEVTLLVSGAMALGLVLALTVNGSHPEQRSIAAANLALIDIARDLQRGLGQALQREAAVPDTAAAWDQALQTALSSHDDAPFPGRDRTFRRLPVHAVKAADRRWEGQGMPPGTLGVWISADRAEFTVTGVGLTPSGAAGVLLDDRDQPIHFRGVYNPDMANSQGHEAD